jgi:hypothetical protein
MISVIEEKFQPRDLQLTTAIHHTSITLVLIETTDKSQI